VIVIPEDNSKSVFNKGKPQISNFWVSSAGHLAPSTIAGAKLK